MNPRADERVTFHDAASAPFAAPRTAEPITPLAGRLFLAGVCAIGIALAACFRHAALFATPDPIATTILLSALVSIANNFGTFQNVGGLAEYTSLGLPIGFAMLLLLDWRFFVFGTALSEILTFVSEFSRRKNPTLWYVRVFNVCSLVTAGAAAAALLYVTRPIAALAGSDTWISPGLAIALLLSALAYKIFDSVQTYTLLALAARESLGSVRIPIRHLVSQLALFTIGIPFARLWSENVWVALYALAPLGVAYRLLSMPELEHRARVDARTGLTNASAFDAVLGAAVRTAREEGSGFALLAIDIDHFKRVNDTYGHLVGDAVIARFAQVLSELARRDDVAARMGGEEFAILMREGDRRDALALAERVRGRIELERFDVDGGPAEPISVTASVGVAVFPLDGATPRELYGAADGALYLAKREGRNLVRDAGAVAPPAPAPHEGASAPS